MLISGKIYLQNSNPEQNNTFTLLLSQEKYVYNILTF